MAISRLRHLVRSGGPSVFRIRHYTTCRSISRLADVQNSLAEIIGNGPLLRPVSLALVNGARDRSLTLKLQMGVRYFSSSEPPSHTVLEMPALSPTMNQGNIVKWRKKEGDKIEVGDVLCEIETDKATVDFESLEEGFLAKILTPEGSKDVNVGQPIAITVEDLDDIKNIPATSGSEPKEDHSTHEQAGSQISFAELPAHTVVEMPSLSPTMNQGNIIKWRKKEGDKIEVGDVMCEIETDKATVDFESLEEGFLAKILTPEGSKDVNVGQPIAITVEDLDDIKNIPATSGSEPKEDHSTHEQAGSQISFAELPAHTVVEMPSLSPTMNQGNIIKWRKKEGDKIEVGDVMCEIETDKATVDFESLEEGFLAKILVPEGTKDVLVGNPIAITVEDADDIKNIPSTISKGTQTEVEEPNQQNVGKADRAQQNSFARISPSAKLLIAEHGLDASSLKASGPHGTLLKGDVLSALKSGKVSRTSHSSKAMKPASSSQTLPAAAPPPSSQSSSPLPDADDHEDLPNSQIRKVIARRLLESKQNTPHLYLSSDVILDPLLSFRKELKEKHNVKVSVNDIVIKAVAVALRNVPEANAYWNVDKGEITLCDSVDISIAVATEKGLMTPIVRNADQKSISAISSEIKELAEKARAGKLAPHEFQGGTFSISNLGMYPVDQFCAIINPPQAGILAVGRGNKVVEPVVGDDGTEKPAAVNKMNLTLSADHRVFDGKVGGSFFSALRLNFKDIRRLLL